MLRMEKYQMTCTRGPVEGLLHSDAAGHPTSNLRWAKKRPWPPKPALWRRWLIATHPSSEIAPTHSQQSTSLSLIATLRTVSAMPGRADSIDSQNHLEMVLTLSKSIECNFGIDRLMAGHVPIPCHAEGRKQPARRQRYM